MPQGATWVFLLLLAAGFDLQAVTVCSTGCDFTSIGQAAASTPGGEVVIMEPGVYVESGISIGTTNSASVIRSVDPSRKAEFIIDGGGANDTVFGVGSGQISGVTIQNADNAIQISGTGTVEDCVIRDTFDGGIRGNSGGLNLTIARCEFHNNDSGTAFDDNGGAVEISGQSLTIRQSLFVNNRARAGGAVLANTTTIVIEDSDFIGNIAAGTSPRGGALHLGGGSPSSIDARLSRLLFRDNQAQGTNSASGGGLHVSASINLEAHGLVFINNMALQNMAPAGNARGGGVYVAGFDTVDRNLTAIFTGNAAASGGGAFCEDVVTSLAGSLFGNVPDQESGCGACTFGDSQACPVALPAGALPGDQFGQAVDIHGNTMVIGMPGSDAQGEEAGLVAVYRIETGGAVLDDLLPVPPGFSANGFGAAVAVSGDTLVIGTSGSPAARKGTATTLAAAIFQRSAGGGYTFKQPLGGSGSSAADGFGASVAISNDNVVVGAPQDDESETAGMGSGAAYVYGRNGATEEFQLLDKLKPADPQPMSRFGAAVATRKDKLVVGAPGAGAMAAGSATVYAALAGAVNRIGTITGSNTTSGAGFGSALDMSGTGQIVVGAPDEDGTSGAGQGAAYLFETSGALIQEVARVQPADPEAGARFGAAVAIDRGTLAVGAPMASTQGATRGAMYRFDVSRSAVTETLRREADDTQDGLGRSVSVYQDKIVTGAPDSDGATGVAFLEMDPRRVFASDFEG